MAHADGHSKKEKYSGLGGFASKHKTSYPAAQDMTNFRRDIWKGWWE